MFASAKLFSNITCPYHNECMLPDCIFAHPEDGGGEDEDIAPASVSTPHEQGIVGLETSEHVVEPKSDKSSDSTLRSPSKTKDRNGNPRRLLTDQDISPPPLRRKALNGSSIPVKSSAPYENGMKRQNPNDATTPSATRTTPKAPTGAAPKKEALNPRHLPAGAPAKFEIRFRLVTMLHEHLTRLNSELAKDANDEEEKLVLSDQELITMTLDMEENAALYQTSIYSNVVKNHILMYKKMLVGQWKDEREADLQKVKAAEAALLSNKSIVKSTEPPKPIETGLTTDEELQVLPRLYTPISGLSKHGYVNSIPTDKDIETAQQGIEAAKGWEVCDRCKARFQVFPERREQDGALTSGGSCTYHYGKPYWQERSAAEPKAKREKRYRCCGQAMGDSSGCTEATSHVFKISEIKRMAAVLNFEKTPENPNKVASRPVCIDGEMGYTVFGLELIRLTATSWPTGVELFDILVRPMGPVLDLNSRFSGVWPNDLAEAHPWDSASGSKSETGGKRQLRIVESPAAARALLFSHISPATPLIGHGLENDLNATRIIHGTVIDTALLFPHKAGLPYRNGLKTLMHTHLNRHIQVVVDGKMDGHDSKEDANAAGDLVRFALANEWQKMKRDGWLLKDGKVTAPGKREPLTGATTGPIGRKRSREEMDEVEEGEVEA